MNEASEPTRNLAASLNLQRKAAIVHGGAVDHAGRVTIERMNGFDLDRTIFGGLGGIARQFMREKLARQAHWPADERARIEAAYVESEALGTAREIDHRLIRFMRVECNFSMEHADGTFLEHLVFCHDYSARHYPAHSPNVALLHSILGTATNTFAMEPGKWPSLQVLLSDFEAIQVQAFPSILRLLYDGALLAELRQNRHRLDRLNAVHCHRVIDNSPLAIDAENFWINLNYHLMHFVDFMPAANWSFHRNDPLMQMFQALSEFLDEAGQRQARVEVRFAARPSAPVNEYRSLFGRVSALLPASLTLGLARRSIRQYSAQAGHDLAYRIDWRT